MAKSLQELAQVQANAWPNLKLGKVQSGPSSAVWEKMRDYAFSQIHWENGDVIPHGTILETWRADISVGGPQHIGAIWAGVNWSALSLEKARTFYDACLVYLRNLQPYTVGPGDPFAGTPSAFVFVYDDAQGGVWFTSSDVTAADRATNPQGTITADPRDQVAADDQADPTVWSFAPVTRRTVPNKRVDPNSVRLRQLAEVSMVASSGYPGARFVEPIVALALHVKGQAMRLVYWPWNQVYKGVYMLRTGHTPDPDMRIVK